jgi:hypothetical protein
MNNVFTVENWGIAAERHHNPTGNRPGAVAHLELYIKELQIFFSFWVAGLCGKGKIAWLSTLIVGTQQVWEKYNMQRVVTR